MVYVQLLYTYISADNRASPLQWTDLGLRPWHPLGSFDKFLAY